MPIFSAIMIVLIIGLAMGRPCMANDLQDYSTWNSVGKRAAKEAFLLMDFKLFPFELETLEKNFIAMTNAGFAEINSQTTEGCLDGLSQETGVSRGRKSLQEIHTHPGKPLFFAIYHKESGLCAYLQVDPKFEDSSMDPSEMEATDLFSKMSIMNIKAENLFDNPEQAGQKFDDKIFGGNEFAVVTILNAVDAGAPNYAIRSFEFHDHYCPGVTSGIMMAQYVKEHLPMQTPSDSYFVQGIQPWCKEDALMVMLNATPGKGGYAVTYPTAEDKAGWWSEFQDVVNIIYRKNGDTGIWDGLALGFQFGDTGCPSYDNSILDKLCKDLWYLDKLDTPEDFVFEIVSFEMPEVSGPKDWARPGLDLLAE